MVFQKVKKITVINQTKSKQTRKMRENQKDMGKKMKAGEDRR
jgi:hypothetical protein